MSDNRESIDLTKLDGSNYPIWHFRITLVLDAENLLKYVDGSEDGKEPDKDTKATDWVAWKKATSRAAVIIYKSVDKKIHPGLINCTGPKQMWDKLASLYGETTEDSKVDLWEQFYTFKINSSESIDLQIEKFESICKKLVQSDEKLTDSAKIAKFLGSLPQKFSAFRMSWECTPKDDRKFDSLTARVRREEKRLLENSEEASSLALQVQAMALKQNKSKTQKPSGKYKKSRIEELKKRTKCTVCHENGHWARECPENLSDKNRQLKSDKQEKGASASKIDESYVCDISALYALTSPSDEECWLADSGAGKHMSFKKEYFSTLEDVSEKYYVKTADNNILSAEGMGTVTVLEEINGQSIERKLTDVLYVPGLRRNLFSISKIPDKSFSFHVFQGRCEVRDKSGKLTSAGVRYGNLYRMLFSVKSV